MNRISLALLGSLLVLLGGCNAFVSPPVTCESITVSRSLKATANSRGYCDFFPPILEYSVTHSPKVPTAWADENGTSDLAFANTPVKVTAWHGYLCEGPSCTSGTARELTIRTDDRGSLSYSGYVMIGEEGRTGVGKGGVSGVWTTESYGPGGTCTVNLEIAIECEENTDTATK